MLQNYIIVIAVAGVGALLLPGESSTYLETIKSLDLSVWLLAPAKFLLVWPLVYHTINGVRHLVRNLLFIIYLKSEIE